MTGTMEREATSTEPATLKSIIEQLGDFDTALLANTIGYIDPTPAHEFYMSGCIQSLTPALGPTVGVAVTCEVDSSSPTGDADWKPYYAQLERMERMNEPIVWVVKAAGSRPDHECVMGDGMGKLLSSVGCVGVVTDGRLRDVEGLLTIPFAAYGRGRTIHHTNVRFTKVDEPMEIGGIIVHPGDVVHANIGGVIVIPPDCLQALPERAAAMRAFEHQAHCVFRQSGLSVADKRARVTDLLAEFGFSKPLAV